MNTQNIFIYITTVLIWGSTWLAIKYQIGDVDPLISIGYRFALASATLIVWCWIKGLRMRFSRKDHLFMALQGLFLFSTNYWLVYVSELYLTSGLVAVTHSTIIFMNVINGFILLGSPVRLSTIVGAVMGLSGIGLIFWPEISSFSLADKNFYALALSFLAAFLASVGNIVSARNQNHRLPVIQTNAFGMGYGALLLLILAMVTGKSFSIPMTLPFISALIYLAVFGSIAGFGLYLTLLGRIGADKAAYAIMVVPVVALAISTVFEGYVWTLPAATGLVLVLAGNMTALKGRSDKNLTLKNGILSILTRTGNTGN
ncbi:MAG: EamA family transporter [Desulfobacteraceae bacterium]|nr:EamA family transporter [Desulfobacteraceae bacterium]